MISQQKNSDLSRLYKVMSRVERGHPLMMEHLATYIQSLGKTLNETWAPRSLVSRKESEDSMESPKISSNLETGSLDHPMDKGSSLQSPSLPGDNSIPKLNSSPSSTFHNSPSLHSSNPLTKNPSTPSLQNSSLPSNHSKSLRLENNPIQWVEELLILKRKFDSLLDSSFEGDKSFQTEMNSAFESVLNDNRKAPEFLSLFIDDNLKKGLKGVRLVWCT